MLLFGRCFNDNQVPQFLKTEELKIADRIKDEPILEAWVYGPLIYPLNVLAQLNEEDGKAYMYQDALYNLFKVGDMPEYLPRDTLT